jgi:hypothetical protein
MWGLAIGAAMGGGIAALQHKDVLTGALMGGATGALGGALAPAMGITGGVVEGASSGVANVAPGIAEAGLTGTSTVGGSVTGAQQAAALGSEYGASQAAPVGKGFFDSGVGKFISDNKMPLGIGAAGLLALNKSGSSNQNNSQQESYIRPYEFNQTENPDYQGIGTPYFKQSYTAKAPIKSSNFGATTVANGGVIRMADGGETTQEQRESTANPTLDALAVIQQAQQTYQPPSVSQGITQPMIQPQMAQIQQQYAAPQRQAPAAFQYETPAFVKYGTGAGSGSYGGGGGSDGVGGLIDPVTKQPVKTAAQIIAAKAAVKPAATGVSGTYTGPGQNGDAESYYDRYPIAEVYDYANNQPTRPNNPTEGSPEFNVRSNQPVDPSSGLAEMQQRYANMGYTDYTPSATNVDGGGANGGLMPDALHYAMGGGIGDYYASPDDGNRNFDGISGLNQGPQYPMQGVAHADGGMMNYAMGGQLGGYSDGGQLLKGPGDGVSDDIPAQIGTKQPARLADGEFVVPARIVSELGNGSTDAGAKRLYAMMERVQANRKKTIGKGKVAVNSKSDKYLPT